MANENMVISQGGINLIKKWEGVRLTSYQDSVGVWTIGYGHTKGVTSGMSISQAQAEAYLKDDITSHVVHMKKVISVNLNQNQFDALASFHFNLGPYVLQNDATLLGYINKSQWQNVGTQMKKYVYAGGSVLQGLVNRRNDEVNLFLTAVTPPASTYPAIEVYSSVILITKATNYYDGSIIPQAVRGTACTVIEAKNITKQSNSVRIYKLKELNQWVLEQDVTKQVTTFAYIGNYSSVILNAGASQYVDLTTIPASVRSKAYTIVEQKSIVKRSNSVRIYKLKELNQWVVEQDVTKQATTFAYIANHSSVMLNANASQYFDNSAIPVSVRSKAYTITEQKSIVKRSNSVRIYKLKELNQWVVEQDITKQNTTFAYIANHSSVMLNANASQYFDNSAIPVSVRSKAYTITDQKSIVKRSNSVRIYKLKELNQWAVEQDITLQSTTFPYLAVNSYVVLQSNASQYYDNSSIPQSVRGKSYTITDQKSIVKRSNSVRIYKLKELNQWVVEQDVRATTVKPAVDKGTLVVDEAKKQLGIPYKWAGKDRNGFDCSGLVQYVYANAVKMTVSAPTGNQEKLGKEVSLNSLLPGDLLFWGPRGNTSHVAIFIASGQYIHSPQEGQNVKVGYFKDWAPAFARRILN
ncbi:C40 family peptidase [Vagococcus sp. BWB3-3]|uniref:Lysozyme n=1 Tax=Vagococcus allomyrinae TaxID=2794353 RepID=A0A940SYQ5_9ENTE|nr:NlpC/P60 family protein [Vagococcus allomyrinae]MBP1043633.1 C40 family peptidase [Vagococcus allomyrinae]